MILNGEYRREIGVCCGELAKLGVIWHRDPAWNSEGPAVDAWCEDKDGIRQRLEFRSRGANGDTVIDFFLIPEGHRHPVALILRPAAGGPSQIDLVGCEYEVHIISNVPMIPAVILKALERCLADLYVVYTAFGAGFFAHDTESLVKSVQLNTIAQVGIMQAMNAIHKAGLDPLRWLRKEIEVMEGQAPEGKTAAAPLRRQLNLWSETKPWIEATKGKEE